MERRRSKLLPDKRKWNRTAKVEVVQTAETAESVPLRPGFTEGKRRQQSFNINAIYSSNFAFYVTNTHTHTLHTLNTRLLWQAHRTNTEKVLQEVADKSGAPQRSSLPQAAKPQHRLSSGVIIL